MNKKVLFIINPKAGKGAIRSSLLDILDIFVKADFDLTTYVSQEAGDARRKAAKAAREYDLIVCSGGDGTLDEVMSGIMDAKSMTPIGYIPCGSTNDFATSAGISRDMLTAAQAITRWNEFPCDVGMYNDDYFVYIAAFGLFTDVSYETPQDIKNVLGHLAYVLEGMKRLVDIKSYEMTIEADAQVIEGEFLFGMVTNSTSVGGFKKITGKNVQMDDGVFEVTLIRRPHDLFELNEIIQAVLTSNSDNTKYFYQFTANRIRFTAGSVIPWTLDGEFGGYHREVTVCNNRQAMTLLV